MANVFAKFEGGAQTPEGEATDNAHSKWIDLDSVSVGVSRPIQMGATGRKRTLGGPQFSEVSCSCQVSAASNNIMTGVANGTVFTKVTIHFCRAGSEGSKAHEPYEVWTLQDVIVTNYSVSGSGDGALFEVLGAGLHQSEPQVLQGGRQGRQDVHRRRVQVGSRNRGSGLVPTFPGSGPRGPFPDA